MNEGFSLSKCQGSGREVGLGSCWKNLNFFTSFPSRRVWLHQHSLAGTHLFISSKTCSTTRHNSNSSNSSRHGGHAWPLFARHNLQFAGSRACLGTLTGSKSV
jgi:hypothetical protein